MVRRRSFAALLAAGLLPALLSAQSLEPDEHRYTYDAANNLTSRTTVTGGMETTETFSVDSSGRNRPASLGGVPLAWDANGNLIQKGNLRFAFDYRNRLREVRSSEGDLLASYVDDALGRRVQEITGTDVTETVWSQGQPVETIVNGVLASRRTYGAGLDEIVYIEQDLDLDGTLETHLFPIYDHSGNLVVVAGEDGRPIERYSYDPYGRQRIYVDVTRPEVEQVRATGTALQIELSEQINTSLIDAGIETGSIRLEDADPSTTILLSAKPLHLHGNRHRLTLTPDPVPAPGTQVTLTVAGVTLSDYFLNPATDFEVSFAWPAESLVVFDARPPKVVEIAYSHTALEVEFSETVDPVTATPGIQFSGMTTTWSVDPENNYRLLSASPLPDGTHDLLVTADLEDASGKGLTPSFSFQLHVYPDTPFWIAYREPDSREVTQSSVANRFGFHGLPRDPITGFVYMRNRYYDPEMGRFITPDPMGYVDGPSLYAAFGNDPINMRDPFGLNKGSSEEVRAVQRHMKALAAEKQRQLILERERQFWHYVATAPAAGSEDAFLQNLVGFAGKANGLEHHEAITFVAERLGLSYDGSSRLAPFRGFSRTADFFEGYLKHYPDALLLAEGYNFGRALWSGARWGATTSEVLPLLDDLAEQGVQRGGVRLAQRGVSSRFRHGEFAGRTIDDVAAGLRSGAIRPEQLPVQTITRDGVRYTLNNRSLMALRQAGLEPTALKDVTGNAFFEAQLTQRLSEIGGQVGPDFVPIVRGGN